MASAQRPRSISLALLLCTVTQLPIWGQAPFRVKDIVLGMDSSSPLHLTVVGTTIFLVPADDGSGQRNLWKSNGTEAGTVLVKSIPDPTLEGPVRLFEAGGLLFFRAWDGSNSPELWRSDGTTVGTHFIADNCPDEFTGSEVMPAAEFQGELFFRNNNGIHGTEPWRSGGLSIGTEMIKDIRDPGGSGGVIAPKDIAEFGGYLYFPAQTSDGIELWRTDLSGPGTSQFQDIQSGPGDSSPHQLTTVGDTMFFSAFTQDDGRELWKVDQVGGSLVASQVLDIQDGLGSSEPDGLTAVGDRLFFFADDGQIGREPWISDGTPGGTQPLLDIVPGASGSIEDPGNLPPGTFGTNGTLFFFRANDSQHGIELWVSDGTPGGTQMTRDIHPGTSNGFPPAEVTPIGDVVYFRGEDSGGTEVWVTDGTEVGTTKVSNIEPGGSHPSDLTDGGGNLFFTAFETATGRELWSLYLGIFADGFETGDTDEWSATSP